MSEQFKQLIRVDTLDYPEFEWNNEVHVLMANSEYRLISISTTTDIATGHVNHYAWFEHTMKASVAEPDFEPKDMPAKTCKCEQKIMKQYPHIVNCICSGCELPVEEKTCKCNESDRSKYFVVNGICAGCQLLRKHVPATQIRTTESLIEEIDDPKIKEVLKRLDERTKMKLDKRIK